MTPLPPELLRAICENPHDDNLRLIAADWWEEAGECGWQNLFAVR